MDDEQRTTVRIISEHKKGLQLDLFATGRAVMGHGKDDKQGGPGQVEDTYVEFCANCEFVRIMNPEGVGWCKEHGDIDGRDNDPRDHVGESL